MVQGAVYDAVNAITPKHHRPYLLRGDSPPEPRGRRLSPPRRTAFSITSSRRCPRASRSEQGDPAASGRRRTHASLAAIPDNSFKRQGIDAGNAAADAMIAARQGDGRFGPSQWVPNSNVGHWDPVAPNGTMVQDPTPWVGGVEPFLMESSSQFRSAGPLGAHERRLHGRVQRGQGARRRRGSDALGPHGDPDIHRQVVAEQRPS